MGIPIDLISFIVGAITTAVAFAAKGKGSWRDMFWWGKPEEDTKKATAAATTMANQEQNKLIYTSSLSRVGGHNNARN